MKQLWDLEDLINLYPHPEYFNAYYESMSSVNTSRSKEAFYKALGKQLGVSNYSIKSWLTQGIKPHCVRAYEYLEEIDFPKFSNHPNFQYFGELFLASLFSGSEGTNSNHGLRLGGIKHMNFLTDYFNEKFDLERANNDFGNVISKVMNCAGYPKKREDHFLLPEWVNDLKPGTLTEVLIATSSYSSYTNS